VLHKNWEKLIKPYKVVVQEQDDPGRYARIVYEPLESGFGMTFGNALRRILLSSLRGAAITEVVFRGTLHEFSTLPGVVEDVAEIIINLKGVRFKLSGVTSKRLSLEVKGPCTVTAGMFEEVAGVKVLTPERPICTLAEGAHLSFEAVVSEGKGYFSVQERESEGLPLGTILVDALFSPVKRAAFFVDHTRVGQDTNYDKLTLSVETDGSITPEEAVGVAARVLQDQSNIFDPPSNTSMHRQDSEKIDDSPFDAKLLRKVEELDFPLRAINCFKKANIVYVGDLVTRSEADLLKTPNFGKKTLDDMAEILSQYNLSLGMDLEGWPPKDIDALAEKLVDNFTD
jgi:DNA-directed RNA polymerase subunit alpha